MAKEKFKIELEVSTQELEKLYNAACCTSYEYYIHTALEVVWNTVSNEAEKKRCQFELLKLYNDARLRQKELDDVGHQLIQNLIIKNWN